MQTLSDSENQRCPLQRRPAAMTHEDFNRQEEVNPSSDRSFGLVVAIFFLLVAFWPLIRAEPIRWWALGVAAVIAVLALLWTAALAPLNKLWTKLGILLYRIVSPVVMALLFYVTVTPIALLMRVLGKDPLRLRRAPDAASYWIDRTPPGPAPESMKNQF
jgi:Saxitoxin biosynthesis operon protein SxtJ